jgi:hypothetical protein
MKRGVLYIASGSEYIEEAIGSANSVERNTELQTTLVTDREVTEGCFDTVIRAEEFCYHYGDSVLQIPDELPYERTLVLDTDTFVSEEIGELFDMMAQFDIGASTIANSDAALSADVPESFPEYNTGVVVFDRNDRTHEFLREWKQVYRTHVDEGVRVNQPSFREALYRSDLRVATIPTEYNCRVNFGGYLKERVKILHGDVEDPEAKLDQLNKYEIPRLFATRTGRTHVNRIETV